MNYGAIKPVDIADGIGVRVALYVSGCRLHCHCCHNKEAWDFSYGEPYTAETEDYILQMLSPAYIRGLSILGGEPLEPENYEAVLSLCRRVREELPAKDIWLYTGFDFEDLYECDDLLQAVDIIVDGAYIQEQGDMGLLFRGSRNQRIIDVRKTLTEDRIVLWKDPKVDMTVRRNKPCTGC